MGQVNRYIRDNPALDDVDHALGRPFNPHKTYRNHYATDCPEKVAEFQASEWWDCGPARDGMTFCYVSSAGRNALAKELKRSDIYGRLYSVSRPGEWEGGLVMAKSPSAARYAAFLEADVDWPYMEYCKGLRVRLAVST